MNLYYQIENHIWVRPEDDGTVTLGFTDIAQTTAGNMLHVTYRPLGKKYPQGKAVAVVESAKWLGSLRTPMAGELIAVNETLSQDAGLINRSPYVQGWLARLKPDDLENDLKDLVTGKPAIAQYEEFMDLKKLDDCIHCEEFEMP